MNFYFVSFQHVIFLKYLVLVNPQFWWLAW